MQLFKSLVISKMCRGGSATGFRFISWSHTAHSSGVVPTTIHNFGLQPISFAMLANQKKCARVHTRTHRVCFLLQREDSPCLRVSVGSSGGSSSPLVRPCLSEPGRTKKDMCRSDLDMIDCSDLPCCVFYFFPFPTAFFSCCSCQLI